MSFLAPFYILGALGVSLPILFHLIRRTPRGRLPFSSLMFLRPSPPRITRRSRLDNILLLLLRAAVLCILALAFARPFLREAEVLSLGAARGRRVAILLDTSASMRRGDLWARAVERVEELLRGSEAADRIALFAFDDRVRELAGFEDLAGVLPSRRVGRLSGELSSLHPTWAATDLGAALAAVADTLDASREDPGRGRTGVSEIVLVSDLQEGSRLEALSTYEWPEGVQVTVNPLTLPGRSNAGLSVLPRTGHAGESHGERVRVTNGGDSQLQQFSLEWGDGSGERRGAATASFHVPAGESRVVVAQRPDDASGLDRLVLSGDDEDFDNTFYMVPGRREAITVAWVGTEAPDDAAAARFYAERALSAGDHLREVRLVTQAADRSLPPDPDRRLRLVIVTEKVTDVLARDLVRYVESGGTVLCVIKDPELGSTVGRLIDCPGLTVSEAQIDDYAMLADLDFRHPLFAPFADPRFSDFTRIRFWRHRRVDPGAAPPREIRIIARFDDGDPAIVERSRGQGRVLALASGWQPLESQLALSSKFVPLLSSLLDSPRDVVETTRSVRVNDAIPLPQKPQGDTPRRVRRPDGTETRLAATASRFDDTRRPGIYTLDLGESEWQVAVNLSPEESLTTPLGVEQLENRGVRLGGALERSEVERQMRDRELESTQKLWRWLLVGALGLLVLETWFAGRLARSAAKTGGSG